LLSRQDSNLHSFDSESSMLAITPRDNITYLHDNLKYHFILSCIFKFFTDYFLINSSTCFGGEKFSPLPHVCCPFSVKKCILLVTFSHNINIWVLAGFEPYSLDSQSSTLPNKLQTPCCRGREARTLDPRIPNAVRYQLRYAPIFSLNFRTYSSTFDLIRYLNLLCQ
jgi:hypothetical protein